MADLLIQVVGCVGDDGGDIHPFVPDEDSEFWGVYVGGAGRYLWEADFLVKDEAIEFAKKIAQERGGTLADTTFKRAILQ